MSFFLVTNSKSRSDKASKAWNSLGFMCQEFDIYGVHVVLTSGYKKAPVFIEQTSWGAFFTIGTFFTDSSFAEDEIFKGQDVRELSQEFCKSVFGHYVFVIIDRGVVRVLTDPVGTINVFYSVEDSIYSISNDLVLTAGLVSSPVDKLGECQFLLNENTVGSRTVFEKVKRTGLGKTIVAENGEVLLRPFYDLKPERVDFEDYISRIRRVFQALNHYNGKIAVDTSAGLDTRLVLACSKATVSEFHLITNQNKTDHGVDEFISKCLSQALCLDLDVIKRPVHIEENKDLLTHSFSVGRDIIRSSAWQRITKDKYELADLLIGGYGGEAIRAKYCGFNGLEGFLKGFYKANSVKDPELRKRFLEETKKEVYGTYLWSETDRQLCNNLYALDRMRSWGGSAIQAAMIYGDRYHPFMDWYLLGPVLDFSDGGLQTSGLQEKLIERLSPGLTSISVNPTSVLLVDRDGYAYNETLTSLVSIVVKGCRKLDSILGSFLQNITFTPTPPIGTPTQNRNNSCSREYTLAYACSLARKISDIEKNEIN
ncbi:hypothetical protein KUV59_10580 [Marinobacter daepoensis]|uniref:hypothetical protein n=1 Tax=Marinobacter daepoensis TaxID=262077 RepID=UPI001C949263|nr:hypothetical protein [Marinobacter daepoensis]MBY6033617.1 hypothetical protein [Marinobacter daepoensis]